MRGDDAVIENSSATGAVSGTAGGNDIGGLVGAASNGAGLNPEQLCDRRRHRCLIE